MCAAVADYTPVNVSAQKIKKQDNGLNIELKKTTDILKTLGQQKQQAKYWLALHWKPMMKRKMQLKSCKRKISILLC